MPDLTQPARLTDYQQYVAALEIERGFSDQSVKDKCLLLGEEIGELFKAVRKVEGLAIDPNSTVTEVKDEVADVFIFLCAIANRFDIDMEKAFLEKEAVNKQRKWSVES